MDLEIVETLNGGDLVKKAKDLSVICGLQNMPYLALFGGNTEESTPVIRLANKQYHDFWANEILWPKNLSLQFNSETERVLNTVALTSSGRVVIEQAIKKDLEFLRGEADVRVSVSIINDDRITIAIQILQQTFAYIWDATNRELTEADVVVGGGGRLQISYFDEFFDIEFA